MIATSRLLDYPLLAIAPEMQRRLSNALEQKKFKPNITAYLNSYFHVVGIYLDENAFSNLEEIDDTLYGFEGYLLSNTKLTETFVAQTRTKAKTILAATLKINWSKDINGIKNTRIARQKESLKFYNFVSKSESLLRYYSGWWAVCRDGKEKFVNLIRPFIHYGEELTQLISDIIQNNFIKYSANTCKTKLFHLNKMFNLMCDLYPDKESLNSLQIEKNVNEFVEILYATYNAHTIASGFNLKNFHNGWPQTIEIIEEIFLETEVMANSEWPLLRPTYKSASQYDVADELTTFEKALIEVPLEFSDEEAYKAFEALVNDDLSFIEKSCIELCGHEIKEHNNLADKAKHGKIISDFSGLKLGRDFNESDILRTWQAYTYNIEQTTILKAIPVRTLIAIIKPLRAHTLLPHMHILVQNHPIITPPWLIEFELFDSNGQQVNYTQSGNDWIATSFKPRAKGHEQQSIVLNQTTKRIFDEIIVLTKDSRDYLKSIGDDSYRRLFLSGGGGLKKPTPINTIAPVGRMDSLIPMRNVMLENISQSFTRDRVERIIARLSLRTLRDTTAIQIYLQTMSMEAVAIALGHAPGNSKSGEVYIPKSLQFFMMERWLRLFQNAIVYEAMKDSPYLLQAMDFNTLKELDEFLLTHKAQYRILPASKTTIYQPPPELKKPEYDRLYIELNLGKLEILLCIYEIIRAALRTGTKLLPGAMQWYPIATLVYQAVHLHKEGVLASYCSRSVLALFSQANPSAQLMEKIKGVVHA
jgi:hypothetical protein